MIPKWIARLMAQERCRTYGLPKTRPSCCTCQSRCSEMLRDPDGKFHQCIRRAAKLLHVNPGEARPICDVCAGFWPGYTKTDLSCAGCIALIDDGRGGFCQCSPCLRNPIPNKEIHPKEQP
jgi:hypothetical protein